MKATDIVIGCENRLGFTHVGANPLYRARAIEAGKINKKLKADPSVTLEDFALALEYCHRKREPVTSPVALYWRIKDARAMANEVVELSDLSAAVQTALDWEMERDPSLERTEWIGRLTRAHGDHRAVVLSEWKRAGRGGS